MLAVVLDVTVNLWLYNTVLVDTIYNAPARLAAAVVGAGDPVGTIDAIWESGGTVAGNLWTKGNVLTGFGFLLAGAVVWCLIGLLCSLRHVLDRSLEHRTCGAACARAAVHRDAVLRLDAQALLGMDRFHLANYALITILTVMVAALLLQVVQSYAAQTAARGSAIFTVDALPMMLIAGLVLLILRRVMPIASSVAGEAALSSFGIVSRTLASSWRRGLAVAGPAAKYAAPRVVRAVAAAPTYAHRAATAGARAGQTAYRRAGAGIQALSQRRPPP